MTGQECHLGIGQFEVYIRECVVPARVTLEQVLKMNHANKIQVNRESLQGLDSSIRLFVGNLFKQCASELLGIKDSQVVNAFTNPDKANRDF